MKENIRLGEALVGAGLIDEFQLQSALGRQRQWGGRLGKALIDMGFLDEATLVKFLSEKLKFPAIDLSRSHIAAKTFEALPKNVAEKYTAVPVLIKDTPGKKTLMLAMADPTDLRAIDEIEFITNYKIESVVALESAIQKVLDKYGYEHVGEPQHEPSPITVEEHTGRVEVIQGDMDMLEEVRKAQTVRGSVERHPTSTPKPPLPKGERELDFTPPPLEAFEEEGARIEDDTPLEMVAEEVEEPEPADAEVIEEAEVIEDLEPVEEAQEAEAETVAVGAATDPYEYEAVSGVEEVVETAEVVEEGNIEEAETLEVKEEPVAVVQSIEELAAVGAETVEVMEAVEEAEPVEAVENAQPVGSESIQEGEQEAMAEIRAELERLKIKIEGLVSLFILHKEGKLSSQDFIEELRQL